MLAFVLYFTLGMLAVLALHRSLRTYVRMSPDQVKKTGFWTAGIGLALGSLLSPAIRKLALLGLLAVPWQRAAKAQGSQGWQRPKSRMSAQEAREVLGVDAQASREEIEEAYRRLMRINHPDQGGSEYFAKKLNEARDLLLKGKP